ncbi:hypothetical protein GF336_03010 [Candidatus Woesearchaeota archaeon]|nr:hypothetical protein [Candidatus Woesearchaeota archaeon]
MKKVILFVLLMLALYACRSPEQPEISSNPSVEDLASDPKSYIGREVEIKARFLESEYLYWAEFKDNESNRLTVYTLEKENRLNKSKYYNIKGIMKYGKVKFIDYPVTENIPYIEATEPIEEAD